MDDIRLYIFVHFIFSSRRSTKCIYLFVGTNERTNGGRVESEEKVGSVALLDLKYNVRCNHSPLLLPALGLPRAAAAAAAPPIIFPIGILE
jgi:hypothetical protein